MRSSNVSVRTGVIRSIRDISSQEITVKGRGGMMDAARIINDLTLGILTQITGQTME